LYGLGAITANNGWVMSVTGALIVFSGLAVLSFVISQLHKVLNLWENRVYYYQKLNNNKRQTDKAESTQEKTPSQPVSPQDMDDNIVNYMPLLEELGESFQLSELYALSQKKGFVHPHLSITYLRQANILISQGDGIFIWKQQKVINNL